MARDLDDDAAARLAAAEENLLTQEQQDQVLRLAQLENLRKHVTLAEFDLTRGRRLSRIWRAAAAAAAVPVLTAGTWTLLEWGHPGEFLKAGIACAVLFGIAALVGIGAAALRRRMPSRRDLEDNLDADRTVLRLFATQTRPSLTERRVFYREDVSVLVGQYQADSRRYRRVHNTLQSLIMIGSATTTTIGALDSGGQPTWQSLTIVGVSFAITLAAMFTGYYKYRERAYFLQQTADSIEEEANAAALGIGPYEEFGPDDEDKLMASFTKRVEDLRNEQRRRQQQQLDQPADQASASASTT